MELSTLQSKVKIEDAGGDLLAVNADGSVNAVVEATDLDIRELTSASDNVAVTTVKPDGTNTMPSLDAAARRGYVQLTDGIDSADVVTNADDDTNLDGTAGLVVDGVLYARIDADTVKPARMDASTHTLQVIDYAHHEIHGGSTFRVQHNDDAIPATAAGGELVIAFFVPDQAKEPHMLWDFVHEGDMTMTVLEGITFNATAGTDVAPKNSNRNSATASVLQGKATGSLVSDYVTVGEESADNIYTGGSVISLKRNYGAKNVGSSDSRNNEVVLKTNTAYAFVLANNETTTQGGQIRLEWYEHSPRD